MYELAGPPTRRKLVKLSFVVALVPLAVFQRHNQHSIHRRHGRPSPRRHTPTIVVVVVAKQAGSDRQCLGGSRCHAPQHGHVDAVAARGSHSTSGRGVEISLVRTRSGYVGDCHGHGHGIASMAHGESEYNGRAFWICNDRVGVFGVVLLLYETTRLSRTNDCTHDATQQF